jgi:predicted type IV restriction endonuclease
MPNISKKVTERLVTGIKQFQPILQAAKSRDVNEADTVTIIKDMLASIFGYDKYTEVTSEYAIRGTYCDLATKIDGRIATLIEVKAVGIELKDQHVKQAVDYAANQGVDWVLLTNGVVWKVYHIRFTKPIEQELVVDINFLDLNAKSEASIDLLFLWCKEGWAKSALGEYQTQKEALSRYTIGALVLSDAVIDVVRRELRKMSPDVRIEGDEIRAVLLNDVIKREVLEGDKAADAKKRIARAANAAAKAKEVKVQTTASDVAVSDAPRS